MNCSNCGTVFRPEDEICRLCGREKAVEAALQAPPPAEETESGAALAQEFALPPAEPSAPERPWLEPAPPPKPSGKWYPSAAPRLAVTAVISAVVMAGIFHLVSRLFNLFILFPLIQGALVGVWLSTAIKGGKCRSGKVAAAFGLAAGLLSYGTGMVFDSMKLRPEIVQGLSEVVAREGGASPEEARRQVEQRLGPWTTFRLAQELQAEAGVTISRYSSSSASPIRGWGYWAIVLLEVCVLAGVCMGIAASTACDRFCEECDVWYRTDTPFKCNAQWTEQMVHSVRSTDWDAAAQLATQGAVKEDHKCEVVFHSCPSCCDRFTEIKTTVGKKTEQLFHGSVPKEAGDRLVQLGRLPS